MVLSLLMTLACGFDYCGFVIWVYKLQFMWYFQYFSSCSRVFRHSNLLQFHITLGRFISVKMGTTVVWVRSVSQRLRCLNTCCPVGGGVWGRFGWCGLLRSVTLDVGTEIVEFYLFVFCFMLVVCDLSVSCSYTMPTIGCHVSPSWACSSATVSQQKLPFHELLLAVVFHSNWKVAHS